jgi:hypothetical protein
MNVALFFQAALQDLRYALFVFGDKYVHFRCRPRLVALVAASKVRRHPAIGGLIAHQQPGGQARARDGVLKFLFTP